MAIKRVADFFIACFLDWFSGLLDPGAEPQSLIISSKGYSLQGIRSGRFWLNGLMAVHGFGFIRRAGSRRALSCTRTSIERFAIQGGWLRGQWISHHSSSLNASQGLPARPLRCEGGARCIFNNEDAALGSGHPISGWVRVEREPGGASPPSWANSSQADRTPGKSLARAPLLERLASCPPPKPSEKRSASCRIARVCT
jgi:hypothetical protein